MAAAFGDPEASFDDPQAFALAADHDDGGLPIVRLRGDLDIAGANALGECLAALVATGRDVTVDLGELRFVDSTGMGALVRARNVANRHGADVRLRAPTANVRKTLSLAGLDKVFQIEG